MTEPTQDARPVLILGPTAGGKTTLAISLAQQLPGGGECISADSMQVYRGMDIGTAKPDRAEQNEIPHHLIDIVDPADTFTVDHWLHAADRCQQDIQSRGRVPIIVGGTNLYVQALVGGFMDGPKPDPAIRAELDALDNSILRDRLQQVDQDAWERIHPNDRRRTIRALEVQQITGTPISAFQGQWETNPAKHDLRIVGLSWPVEEINQRINARVRAMFNAGFVDEVRSLQEANRLGQQASEALGYKQILMHLSGHWSIEETIEEVKIRTRRFAKQQRTWLRRFQHYFGGTWIEPAGMSTEDVANKALTLICEGPPDPA